MVVLLETSRHRETDRGHPQGIDRPGPRQVRGFLPRKKSSRGGIWWYVLPVGHGTTSSGPRETAEQDKNRPSGDQLPPNPGPMISLLPLPHGKS